MNLLTLLKTLNEHQIQISLENDQLKVSAAKGAMTKELMQLLKDNKEALLQWAREKQQQLGLPAISAVNREQPLPLSFNQQGLWFLYQLSPDTASYNMPLALRLRGNLQVTALEQAVTQLLERHEPLRTRLVSEHDSVHQAILPPAPWHARFEALADDGLLPALVETEALTPFRLENSPLFRTRLWQLCEDDYVFMVTLHHIIADAVSIQNLLFDLAALYQSAVQGSTHPLPPLPFQYADFAWWQHNVLAKGPLTQQLHWWKEQLQGAPELLRLPTDKPRPAMQGHRGAALRLPLAAETVQRAKAFALANNYTPFMIFLAAQQLLLGRYARQQDVCVAIPVAGRHLAGTERLVGFFINTLIVRNRFGDNPTVRDYLARTREQVLGVFAHQDAPLDKIIETLGISRNPAFSPIAQIGFNYLIQDGTAADTLRIAGLQIEPIEQTATEAKYDMIWGLEDRSQGDQPELAINIEFNTDLYSEDSIRRFIGHYNHLLDGMLDDLDAPVLGLPLDSAPILANELDIAGTVEQLLPLTPMQRDIYVDTLIDPANRRNYFGWTQIIPAAVDANRLQQAIAVITAANSSLRLRIVPGTRPWHDAGYALIVPAAAAGNTLIQLDWSADAPDDATLVRRCNELAFRPYDLAHEPNLRFHLVKAAPDKFAIVLTAHHACIDGVSLQAITEQYTAVYTALASGSAYTLPDDLYPAYVAQQVRHCDSAASHGFWQQQSQGCEGLSSRLPASRSAGQYQSLYHDDSAAHWAAIQAWCEQHQLSPALYLKALYALMLQSWCYADSDFYFLDILAARPRGHGKAIGCYFEQRPVVIAATTVQRDSRFSKLVTYLQDYRNTTRDKAISNGLIERLFSKSTPQFLFNFYLTERYLPFGEVMSTTTIIAPEMDNAVSFIAVVDGDHLQFNLTWVDSQFHADSFIERLLHLSQQILEGTDELSALSLLLPSEQLLAEHAPALDYPYSSVAAMMAAQVHATPSMVAVKDRHNELTFAELDAQANRLANYLVNSLGVAPGDNVALCLSPNTGFMVALLATLKTGACYIPVDPYYPVERIRHILNDAQARCILAEQCSAGHIDSITAAKLFIDADAESIAAQPSVAPTVAIGLDDPLYTIYTSGSTGLPKGATVKQRGELNLLQWYNREFAIGPGEKVLIISALGFDLTQKNLLGPLCCGATIILPELDVYDPEAALQIIAEEGVTLINCAPSAFYPLAEEPKHYDALQSLRLVLFGGEPIRMNALLPWLENAHCMAQVVNMYGPTECTDISTYYRIEQPHLYTSQPVPIGHANDNVTLFVADSSLRLLPQGLVGELLVGGEGVGLGYRQLPELTREKFIDHPIAGKVYRTGDWVRQRDDGEYVFIGRIDHQVKLRGLRIELGEIEHALKQLPGVKDSLALVLDDKLTGYVLNDDGHIPDNWRAALGEWLPDYMLPQGIAALTQWPLSANGKIDRKALPALSEHRAASRVLPRNETEEQVAAIWREVLGLQEIGVHDSFFELGGHSLLVVRAVARMRDTFQREIPLREVFYQPTIAAIAQLLEQQAGTHTLPPLEPAEREPFQNRFPLSFAQQRLWFIDQLSPGSAVYNMPFSLKLIGDLDVDVLQQAYLDLLKRHEVLRTRIVSERGTAWQVADVDAASTFSVDTVNTNDETLRERATEFLSAPFNLATGPLVRAQLLQRQHSNEYALLLCLHHIIADGWTVEILIRDLLALYQARLSRQTPALPPLAVQYIDYTLWQRQWLEGDVLQQQLDYWRQQLQGVETLELPTDHPRPAVLSPLGRQQRFAIPAALAEALNRYCQQHALTPFMFLLGSFQLLLAKYSGQADISVGSPIANRPVSALDNMAGLFVNTLVLRTTMDAAINVDGFLQQVKHTCLAAYQHQDVPFELLVDELQVPRALSQTPLFQAMFVMQNLGQAQSLTTMDIGKLKAESLLDAEQHSTAKFDLTLNIVDVGAGLDGVLEYRSALFNADTMQRFCELYVRLLQAMLAAPQQPVSAISLLTAAEIRQQLAQQHTHDTFEELPALAAWLEQQAARTPQATAVIFAGEHINYAELNSKANALARQLQAAGVQPGSLVALYQQRSPELVISLLATLKAGAAYVPVDPGYPARRVIDIIGECRPALVLTQTQTQLQLADILPASQATLVVDRQQLDNSGNLNLAISPDSLAYVLFTSGSTGKPKGVMISQAALANHMQWMFDTFHFGQFGHSGGNDRILQKTPFVFDASVWEFWAPLLSGGTLVVAEPEMHKDPTYLARIIRDENITAVQFVPSLLEAFLQVDGVEQCRSLQKVFCGGEPLAPALVNLFHQKLPGRQLVNLYGPTEATIDSSFALCPPGSDRVTIGRPITNVSYLVLDQHLNLLPVGVPGELYIGGRGLARGYLNQPELTAASFIDHPFSDAANERLYKTGDRVRALPNGDYEYLGRIDFQVKVRGFRIEPGEIESALLAIEHLRQVAVIPVNDERGQPRLLAFYTTADHADATSLTPELLRETLKARLPEYMVPAAFIHQSQLPVTHNGKIDRKALAQLPVTFTATSEYVAPRNELEQQVATLWENLLQTSPVGIHDNFFELGGHSLLAIRLCAELGQAFERDIPVRTLFEYPTVAGIVEFIAASHTIARSLPLITPVSRDLRLPLSFNQQGLYFIYKLAPEAASYNIPMALRLRGPLDITLLEQALNRLIERHEILRTAFLEDGEQVYQQIAPAITWQTTVETLPEGMSLDQSLLQEALQPFTLNQAPLFRLRLWQLADNDFAAAITLHHIIADATSMQTLVGELAAIYHALQSGQPVTLAPLPFQYADYAWWQQNILRGEALTEQLRYWREQLQGVPALLNLPTDRPRSAQAATTGAVLESRLPGELVNHIRSFAKEQRLTPFMVLLGAQQLLLGRHARQEDVCVAAPIAGRHQPGTETLPGYFVNALVLRNRFADNPHVATYLQRTKDLVLAAFAHQDAPLDEVLEQAAVPRSPHYNPVVQIGFNYITQRGGLDTLKLGDLQIEPVEQKTTEAKYDMIWAFADTAQGITLNVEYRTALFDENTVAHLMAQFRHLLENLLDDLDVPVLQLPLADKTTLAQELGIVDTTEQLLPLTPMQRDIYLDTLIDPANRRNYFGWTQVIPAAVDANRLQQAITVITAANSSLRLRIVPGTRPWHDAGYALIVPAAAAGNTLIQLDWSADFPDDATLVRRCNELAFRPYDLAHEPNLRFHLVKAAPDKFAIVLTAHHACIDGVSLQAITEQYTAVYTALASGSAYTLPDDLYPAYVAQQVRHCDSAASHGFWQQQSQGCEGLSSRLPASRSAGQYQSLYHDDSAAHWAAIQAWCEQHQLSPALYLKALYALMLQSWCYADSDFYFLDILAARPRGHGKAIGCYFEQRPVVILANTVQRDSRFSKLVTYLQDYRNTTRDKAISNGLIERLFSKSTPQFLFNFYLTERYLPFGEVMSTTTIIAPEMDNAVSFIAVVDGDHLQFNLTWVDSQFHADSFIERLLHLSQQILEGTDELAALSLLLPSEQLLEEHTPEPDYPYSSVAAMISAQVKATPSVVAVKDRHNELTFAELDEQANRLANYLINSLGVAPGDNVALCLSPNNGFMVALLATLKTGACYIPVDPHYPVERIRHILNDAQARCIIAEQCSAAHIDSITASKLFIDADADAIAAQPSVAPTVAIGLDDPLYTIYTSGSTGLPKGATVKQRGELNLLQWYNREFAIGPGEKVLIISALGFDLTQKNLLGPLCCGATIILPELDVYDPEAALQIIAEEGITLINCAPSAFYPLAEDTKNYDALQSLRLVLFGGEPIRMNALLPWLENPRCKAQVVNMYGPTECTDISTYYRIEQPHLYTTQPVPIGHANDNVTLFVADSSLRLLPQGLVGELLVGGEGVGLGYRQLPELTQEKFIDHPIAGKVYRTGDWVRQRDDGEYVFIGRIDHQVKLRGLRIELGEIEHALKQLPGVKDSLALVLDDKLTGYVLNDDGHIPDNWRAALGEWLPDYMLPQGIAALTQWPLSANGKIDRKALPALSEHRAASRVLPRNETEEQVAAIWREVLGLQEIGVHDSFFELGGHSLLVVRAVARMRDTFQREIPLREVFYQPTIAAIAQLLEQQAGTHTLPPLEPAEREPFQNRFPLSFAQQRLWLLEQIQAPSAMYNIGLALQLDGTIHSEALHRSIIRLVERQEALRTRIGEHNGEAYQYLAPANDYPLASSSASSTAELQQQVASFLLQPFTLRDQPLFRSRLVQLDNGAEQQTVLLLCLHHIIGDGLSATVLLQDLAACYAAEVAGTTPALPALTAHYIDYTLWQQQWLQGEVLQQQVDYWRSQLAQVPLLALPLDHPRSAAATLDGGLYSFTVDPATVQRLQAIARQEGATLFMVLLAAYTTLLHRYSGQDDIAIGTPVANRPQAALEHLVGFFVNTLVIRNSIDPQASFTQLLRDVKETAAQAYTHQDLPFERLLDELDIQRDLSHSPLFQAFFSLQTADTANTAEMTIAGTTIRPYALPGSEANPPAKFELGLGLIAQGDTLAATFEYRTALFEPATIERLAQHFTQLLASIAADSTTPVGSLALISAQEQQQQLQQWNATQAPCDLERNILVMFESQAEATPDAIAVRCGDVSLTYAEFNRRANQLARYLVDDRQLPDRSRVVICRQANADFLVSVYAALKAGACYIPVDPAYPDERIRYIIDNAGADIVLADHSQQARFAAMPQAVFIDNMASDSLADVLAGKDSSNLPHRITNDSPLYMIYTSGSTGLPKGVEVIHQGETNLIQWYNREYGFCATDKFLIISAAGFDLTQKNFFAPLCSGGQVVFHGLDHYDPAAIEDIIAAQGITVINCAPSALYPLIENPGSHARIASLRTVLLGGEPIRIDLVRRWLEATGYRCELVNMYGPTECTDITTTYRIRSAADLDAAVIPIGRPIANTRAYILDGNRQLLPAGIAGELYVGGLGVSNGYVGNPALNAATFLPSPFEPNATIYKTGDLVRYRADGEIEYIGRTDHQVKIRGLRIELGEIETAIEAIAGVDQAIVMALHHHDDDQLVAWFSLDPQTDIGGNTLRAALAKRLPDYMVPAQFVRMDTWPLSPNGKINRKALPEPQWGTTEREDLVMPRNAREQAILLVWQEVLKREHISVDDNFFSIGGHSLKAVQVGARLRQQFAIDLALRDLFDAPTIAELALLVQQRQQQNRALPPLTPADRSQRLPLSYAQQRLWFLTQMDPSSPAYNMPAALRISGPLDVAALEQAFRTLVDRHEVFRTMFTAVNGEPEQVIEAENRFHLQQSSAQDDSELQTQVQAFANTPFAIDREPSLRAQLVTLATDDHALLINMYHIISDGWSMPVFIRELGTLYACYRQGLPHTLSPLPLQYADFAAWQRRWLQGETLAREIDWWRNTLHGVPLLLNMPLDSPRPPVQTTHGALFKTTIDSTLAQQLRSVAMGQQATVFMTCLAAYQVLLHKYSHQDDICVGIPLAGRSVPGVQDLIGFFINALAIRTPLKSNLSLAEIIAQVKDASLAAFSHDQIPVEMLINELGIERHLSYTPVIQCAFNMMSSDDALLPAGINEQLGDVQIEVMEADTVTAKFELLLTVLDTGDDMGLSVEYNTDIYRESTIATLVQHYLDILRLMTASVDTRLYEIRLGELALPANYRKALPLTTMQRDIYLATLANPDTLENSLGFAFHMPFAVDVALWENVLREITAQHDILRADLLSNRVPWQDMAYFAVTDSNDIDFELLDWSTETLSDADIQQRLDALVSRPWNLAGSARVCHRLIKVNDTHFCATMAAHHMVLDGFAAVLIGTWMTGLYEKRLQGDTAPFPLEDHFAEYTLENRQAFDRPDTVKYWQQQMATVSGLQAEHSTGNRTPENRLLSLPIPVEHYKALRSYAKQFKITPPLYFKCLYALMISQYTRAENSFVVTEFQAGRNKVNKDSLGCFYHTNPTVVDIASTQGTLAELFEAAREQQKASRDFLEISHLKQMQLMPPSAVHFSYNYLMMPHFSTMLGEVLNGTRYTPNAEGAVDLRVQAFGDELCFWLAYNTRLFDDKRLLERMLHVSRQLVDGNLTHTREIDFTLPDETRTLSAPGPEKLELLPLQVSLQALASRNRAAVVCGNQQLGYGELEARSNVIAQHLLSLGVQVGDRVGICLGRRVELLVAILGAVKAGACYVPMDVNYPAERLAYMLDDCAASVLVTEHCMLGKLPATQAAIVDIDAIDFSVPARMPKVAVGMNDLLYMIYTSGSTGLPKGAAVYHRGESNLLAWYTREFGFTASDKTLVMSAIGFDLTQKNLFALLTVGGTVVFPEGDAYDVNALLDTIEQQQITTLNCAPSAFYPLVELGGEAGIRKLRSLRTVLFGGEPIQLKRLAPWIASDGFACSIVNMYGPTECTDISTFHTLRADELRNLLDAALADEFTFPLGKPNAGVSLYVVNEQLQPVPNGLAGELCVAGISVGAGYWNRPEMTAKAFVPNPFATGDDDKVLYKTGDLVRYNPDDGLLYYIGRKDFQVKLRGLRIELGEIEHALRLLPSIQDVVVLVDNDQLLAFVLTDEQHRNNGIEGWREALLGRLPDYMVPKLLIPVTQWPLTPNGKVDRNALLALPRPDSATQYVAPRTALEKDIAQLWQEVLGIGQAGVFDNFFEAGGDSLAAVRLVAGLEIRFNTKLPVASLFGAQTIAQLAHVINNQLAQWSPIVPIQPQGSKTPIFAVHALGAMVLSYEPLARALGKDQPFYGIQAYGFEEGQTPYTDLNEMLEFYVAAIRQQQPHGPYQLIGHSFGGILAIEIARKLQSLGETVNFVGLLDTHMPIRYADTAVDDALILKTFAEHNFGVVDIPLRAMRLMKPDIMIKTVAERFHGAVTEDFIRSAIAIIRGFQRMMIGFVMQPIDVPVILFRPTEQAVTGAKGFIASLAISLKRKKLGWDGITDKLTVLDVPGDHHSMLKVGERDTLVNGLKEMIETQT